MSRTSKELDKEMEIILKTSKNQDEIVQNTLNQTNKFPKSIVDKQKETSTIKSQSQQKIILKPIQATETISQPSKIQLTSHATLALYKHRNYRKIYGDEKYILDTHSYQGVQNFIDLLRVNSAEELEAPLSSFIFNDSEFDSTNPQKLINQSETQPLSSDISSIIDLISFVRAPYICEEPYKQHFLPLVESEEQQYRQFGQKFIQGKLKSSNFLNGLALLCSRQELINRLCFLEEGQILERTSESGIYAFRFYKNKSQKYTVLIDDKIPCVSLSNGKPIPCFSRSSDENSLWVSLIEKAYAKLNGGYSNLEGLSLREVISDLTGVEPEIIPFIDKNNLNQQSFLAILDTLLKNGSLIGFMMLGNSSIKGGLYNQALEGRIYVLKQLKRKEQKITILNCWHKTSLLNGNRFLKKNEDSELECEYDLSLEDIYQLFNSIVIVKDYPDDLRGVRFDVNLSPSNGFPNASNLQWINNFQLVFDLSDKDSTSLLINVSEIKGIEQTNFISLGFALFTLSEKDKQVKQVNFSNMLLSLKSGEKGDYDEGHVSGFIKLPKGRYSIIPFCNLKAVNSVYLNLEVFYSCRESTIKFYEKSERILDYCLGESSESQPRRLRDLINKEQLGLLTKSHSISYAELIFPYNSKNGILANVTKMLNTLKEPENKKYQQLNRKPTASSVGYQDPLLDNFQDTLINEMLLGLNNYDQEVNKSERDKEKDQQVADQLHYELHGTYDFDHYALQDQGLEMVMITLIAEKDIKELKLAGNNITCEGVVNFCYQLEKSHHFEIQSVDLRENQIGQKGGESLLTFVQRMPKIKTLLLDGNSSIPESLIKKIKIHLNQRNI